MKVQLRKAMIQFFTSIKQIKIISQTVKNAPAMQETGIMTHQALCYTWISSFNSPATL